MKYLNGISTAVAALLIPSLLLSQQPLGGGAGLKIEVLDGEDGVNIIKKKTAVKPVVQVKDKNDLPIAGVAVVIGLGAAGVFDGGSHEAVVMTNANGIATAPNFSPTTQGSFQISVRADYQGQTATASIRQTNFKTVADALKAGRTPGSNSNSQASSGSQSSTAAQQAGSAMASGGGGHGALIGVLVAAGAAGGVGAAYAAGVLGKSNSSNVNSCDAQYSQATATESSLANCINQNILGNPAATCGSLANPFFTAINAYCQCAGGAGALQSVLTQLHSYFPSASAPACQ